MRRRKLANGRTLGSVGNTWIMCSHIINSPPLTNYILNELWHGIKETHSIYVYYMDTVHCKEDVQHVLKNPSKSFPSQVNAFIFPFLTDCASTANPPCPVSACLIVLGFAFLRPWIRNRRTKGATVCLSEWLAHGGLRTTTTTHTRRKTQFVIKGRHIDNHAKTLVQSKSVRPF